MTLSFNGARRAEKSRFFEIVRKPELMGALLSPVLGAVFLLCGSAAAADDQDTLTLKGPDNTSFVFKKVRVDGGTGPLDGQIGEVTRLKGKRKKQLVLRLMDFTAISVTTVEPEYVELVNPEEI